MRQFAVRLRIFLAILVAMLAAGRGLPGLVQAMMGPPAHVCSCAAGGDHTACPVCNPHLQEQAPSRVLSVRGLPCGDPRVAIGTPGEASTLPAPLLAFVPAGAWLPAPQTERIIFEQVIPEPTTPPPRS